MIRIIYLIAMVTAMADGQLTCIGEDGGPVDMFIVYKLPEIKWQTVPPLVDSGYGYLYLDSNNPSFQFGSHSIANIKSPPGRTLNQVYSSHRSDDSAHIFYNDANPQGKEFFASGHTKGALAFDEKSGFWLISSVPKYPPKADDGYEYPSSGRRYGQMLMCITFKSTVFNDIGLQLLYNHPHIHDSHLPEAWRELYPNLIKLLEQDVVKEPLYHPVITFLSDSLLSLLSITNKILQREVVEEPLHHHVATLLSNGGMKYQHFAKSGEFHKDLYFDLVAPYLKCNLITETWQHGKNIGPSCDKRYTVVDVLNLNITEIPSGDPGTRLHFNFENMNDHSKFAVGDSEDDPYVCVGDINRQPSQFKRGGGTGCIRSVDVWRQFRRMIVDSTSCNNNKVEL